MLMLVALNLLSYNLVALLSSSFWCSRAKAERRRERGGARPEGRTEEGSCSSLGPTLKRRGGSEEERRKEGWSLSRLPYGYSHIFRSYVFGPWGFWTMVCYTELQNLIPSFPRIAPPHTPPWRNPRKGRDPILPSGNTVPPQAHRGRCPRPQQRHLRQRGLPGLLQHPPGIRGSAGQQTPLIPTRL